MAASRTDSLTAGGDPADVALNGGYHAAFIVGAIFVLVASRLGVALLAAPPSRAPEGTGRPRATGEPAAVDG